MSNLAKKPYEVVTDCDSDDAYCQIVSRHSSPAAAERAARKYEIETGKDAWVEPDMEEDE